jgi:hypothetical protein
MSERPDSGGLWEREGEVYLVRDNTPTATQPWKFTADKILADGSMTGIWTIDQLPTGNWRKLTAGTPKVDGLGCPGIGGGREFLELRQRIAYLESVCRETLDGLNDVYDGCEDSRTKYLGEHITRLTEAVFPASPQLAPAPPEVIDWQRLREWAADPRKKVPELAFTSGPEREIADLIMMCRVSIEPPEVIEHLKAEILAWREADLYCDMLGKMAGDYDKESDERGTILRDLVRVARDANDEAGYFPPRPTGEVIG